MNIYLFVFCVLLAIVGAIIEQCLMRNAPNYTKTKPCPAHREYVRECIVPRGLPIFRRMFGMADCGGNGVMRGVRLARCG